MRVQFLLLRVSRFRFRKVCLESRAEASSRSAVGDRFKRRPSRNAKVLTAYLVAFSPTEKWRAAVRKLARTGVNRASGRLSQWAAALMSSRL